MRWKSLACVGFPNYDVSEDGRVRHRVSLVIKTVDYNIKGYQRIRLWSCVKVKAVNYTIHRLVALVWCPNPLLKPWVNHDDEDIWNNHRLNLRWVTPAENTQYSKDARKKEMEKLKLESPF